MKTYLIAIDGYCGSGKSTLSQIIKEKFDCNVFHMDDYYLPFSKRNENWEMIPAGNMDVERFYNQVLKPAKKGDQIIYQPYYCREDCLQEAVFVTPKPLTIIEGSYSHHPLLSDLYDLKIFLTCSKEEQKRRLILREGERFPFYESRWIPMEERYYQAYSVMENADVVFDTQQQAVYEKILEYIRMDDENKASDS